MLWFPGYFRKKYFLGLQSRVLMTSAKKMTSSLKISKSAQIIKNGYQDVNQRPNLPLEGFLGQNSQKTKI